MKKCLQKLKSRAGFTFAEALISLLILLMVSAIVAGGMPVAANAYHKVVKAANAQVLYSTTRTALRSQLETAVKEIDRASGSDGEKKYNYYSSETLRTTIGNSEEGIMFYPYEMKDDAGNYVVNATAEYHHPLVSEAAATGLHAEYKSIEYDDHGLFTITGLVVKDSQGNVLVGDENEDKFYVRVLNVQS